MGLLLTALLLPASASASGGDDPLFPTLGNPGYDVSHYTLDLTYGSAAPVQTVPATVTIQAHATQDMSVVNFDFSGDSVSSATVDGAPAQFTRRAQKLAIAPAAVVKKGADFTVQIAYTSGPRALARRDALDFDKVLATAWFATPSGSITAAQPSAAHRILPCDDVPADPATYTFHATTPAGSTFVANGVLTSQVTTGAQTQWTYEQREPMASELIQLAFGALTVRDRGIVDGVHIRDVAPTSQFERLEPAFASERRQMAYMVKRVGRYPFSLYGSLFSDARFPFALEDETLSLFPSAFELPPSRPRDYEPIMLHELSHQWFGDSVMPRRWSDVWLNEGHATWYQYSYARDRFGDSFVASMKDAYRAGNLWRRRYGPVAAPRYGAKDIARMFSPNVYDGGALVLYALQERVGDAKFQRIERAWVRRYAGRAATTREFIALASSVSHRNLRAFLNAWLYGRRVPPMPGHPGWRAS